MSKPVFIIIAVLGAGVLGIALFHLVHHVLFCRFRRVSGRSHCARCGHREVCRKWHHKEV